MYVFITEVCMYLLWMNVCVYFECVWCLCRNVCICARKYEKFILMLNFDNKLFTTFFFTLHVCMKEFVCLCTCINCCYKNKH